MKGKTCSLFPVLFMVAALGGCSSPNRLAVFDDGPIHVQSAFVNRYLQDADSWSGTVSAISTDGRDDIARSVNSSLKAAGYKVADDGNARVTYSVTELYAGPAADYVENSGAMADTVLGTGLSVLSSLAVCAALHSCENSGVVGNSAANALTTVSNTAANGKGQHVDDAKAIKLVVHKVCLAGSCASSAAASADPDVTIDQLRRVNVEKGLPRTMRLKCTFKRFGPIKSVDQC
ncbi:MAG TPA: hypothetical protein VJS90_19785 [Pseudomonas sp.]|uniref:hypothetical protein n=1 Tax=Pseudomonas sp. TaxID=306 RepID=UPI002B45AC90|nr:hypothetical protein [Pseudomonas sp.]HKS15277.1 hypothetical protein [Pseudomonas sp.]